MGFDVLREDEPYLLDLLGQQADTLSKPGAAQKVFPGFIDQVLRSVQFQAIVQKKFPRYSRFHEAREKDVRVDDQFHRGATCVFGRLCG